MLNKFKIFLACFFVLNISCSDDDIIFSETREVKGQQMSWQDSMVFTMNIPDTTLRYYLSLSVDHLAAFNYQNVYLNLHTHYVGSSGSSGLVSVQLQGEDGRWSGDCSSSSCSQEVVLKENIRFARTGDYAIAIHQASRDSVLIGLKAIALTLSKHNSL